MSKNKEDSNLGKTVWINKQPYEVVSGSTEEEMTLRRVGVRKAPCGIFKSKDIASSLKKGDTVFVGGRVTAVNKKTGIIQVNNQWFSEERLMFVPPQARKKK